MFSMMEWKIAMWKPFLICILLRMWTYLVTPLKGRDWKKGRKLLPIALSDAVLLLIPIYV